MSQLHIVGGIPIKGEIEVSGSKNASLPLLICSLLTDSCLTLSNVPDISDTRSLTSLLRSLGVSVQVHKDVVCLHAKTLSEVEIKREAAKEIRASIWLLGPLAARLGKSRVSLPGGCSLNKGHRKIDFHISILESMGANIELEGDMISLSAPRGLHGTDFTIPQKSVGATITGLLSAALARGQTTLRGCAKEPEIVDLCKALLSMGINLEGMGTETLNIAGTLPKGATYAVMPDRLEALTYISAACACGGQVHIKAMDTEHIANVVPLLTKSGIRLTANESGINASGSDRLCPLNISTAPHPGFPTDFQPILASLLCFAKGPSSIEENMYDNRFLYIQELRKMGAEIELSSCGRKAYIKGGAKLSGAKVKAHDIRCGAALIVAALAAKGETIIEQAEQIDRGYQNIIGKLASCGSIVTSIP